MRVKIGVKLKGRKSMNISMWIKAIRVIPRISKEEWDKLDFIARWLIATRFAAIILTVINACIVGLLIYANAPEAFSWGRWLLFLIGVVFAHGTNNLINDLVDYRRGVDKDNYFRTQYGPQTLDEGLLSSRQMYTYIAVSGLIAVAAGLPLVIQGGLYTWLFLIIGAFFVIFYTYPLKYFGLGEFSVLFVYGPLMVAGGYYAITHIWDWNVVIASLPYAIAITTVLLGKHTDKAKQDAEKHIHTIPVLIGEKASRYAVFSLIVLQYLLVVYLVIAGYFTFIMLVIFLGLSAIRPVLLIYRGPKPDEPPQNYPADVWPLWFVAAAFQHTRRYGLVFVAGLMLDIVVKRLLGG
jgi:1,4-dihydroxy-2-naphthoate polyprenyltransferase